MTFLIIYNFFPLNLLNLLFFSLFSIYLSIYLFLISFSRSVSLYRILFILQRRDYPKLSFAKSFFKVEFR